MGFQVVEFCWVKMHSYNIFLHLAVDSVHADVQKGMFTFLYI